VKCAMVGAVSVLNDPFRDMVSYGGSCCDQASSNRTCGCSCLYTTASSLVVHEVCKFSLLNSMGAGREQCGTGRGPNVGGQMGGCQVAARASMSTGTALATHDVLASYELLARWLLRGLV
jgi:hypothetical protein